MDPMQRVSELPGLGEVSVQGDPGVHFLGYKGRRELLYVQPNIYSAHISEAPTVGWAQRENFFKRRMTCFRSKVIELHGILLLEVNMKGSQPLQQEEIGNEASGPSSGSSTSPSGHFDSTF